MIENGFCKATCGRCAASKTQAQELLKEAQQKHADLQRCVGVDGEGSLRALLSLCLYDLH